ncbi:hypothetical protein SOVF_009320 [Spinacia oleracea]|nr:hypothetical protein SOVF_009320 [Spinacia oleracea]
MAKLPILSQTLEENQVQPNVSHDVTLISSNHLRNPNSPPNPESSPLENNMPISPIHSPTTTINSHPFGELNEQALPNSGAVYSSDMCERDPTVQDLPSNVVRKETNRGRPKGSKNKRKAPVFLPRPQLESNGKYCVLKIAAGSDIMEKIKEFVMTLKFGVIFLSAMGKVQNVWFENDSAQDPPIYHSGIFKLVSINGVQIGPNVLTNKGETGERLYSYFDLCRNNHMSIHLNGLGGNLFGVVVGKLVAASDVCITMLPMFNCDFYGLSNEGFDQKTQYTCKGGGFLTQGDREYCVGSSSEAIEFVGDESDWNQNPKDEKRIRFSDF